jgi:hypothetical protein
MMSVIELPSIDQGKYSLEIFLSKLLFMEDSKIKKCLSFNLMIEYVAKNTQTKEY